MTGSIPDPVTSGASGDDSTRPDDDTHAGEHVAETPVVHARVRRAPRFARFVGAGAGLGLVIALVLTFVGTTATGGRGMLFAVLGACLLLLGGIVGALLAIVADRRSG